MASVYVQPTQLTKQEEEKVSLSKPGSAKQEIEEGFSKWQGSPAKHENVKIQQLRLSVYAHISIKYLIKAAIGESHNLGGERKTNRRSISRKMCPIDQLVAAEICLMITHYVILNNMHFLSLAGLLKTKCLLDNIQLNMV